jgi:CelD/BcsL family acetyltransferase involved in cellulose biosynthesis
MTPERVTFRYSLGDLRLFQVSFRAALAHLPFDPTAEPMALPLPSVTFPDGASAVGYLGSLISGTLPPLQSGRSGICYVRNQTSNYYLDLQGTFEEYLRGFSSKTRSTLQRKVRKVAAIVPGPVEYRCFSRPEEVAEFHALAREVAVKTYQEKLFEGAIPATAEFVAQATALAAAGSFRGYILSIEGKPVSYLYLPVESGVVIYGYLGYDPAHADLSPGTVLLYFALEKLFEEASFTYFDFTHGEGQSKKLFGRASFLRADVYLFRWTPRNIATVYGHYLMDAFSSAVGRLLDKLGARQKIRNLLRRM